jgi:hypothetical protein
MSENVVEKAVHYFNDGDLESLVNCWHENISIYELKTNKLCIKGRKQLKESNKDGVENEDAKIEIVNSIELGDVFIIEKSVTWKDDNDVSICEIENNLIKTVWFL